MLNPARRLDDFLIDRVFQKIADALHRLASCFALGSFFMTGFAILHFAFWAWGFVKAGASFDMVLPATGLAMALLWVPSRVAGAFRLERQWCEGRDVLPDERVSSIFQRLFFLLFLPFDFLFFVADMNRGLPVAAAADMSWELLVIGLYFLACTPKRPRQHRQARYAHSFGGL